MTDKQGNDHSGLEWLSLKEIEETLGVAYWRVQQAVSVLRKAGILHPEDIRRRRSDERIVEVRRAHLETIRNAVLGHPSGTGDD